MNKIKFSKHCAHCKHLRLGQIRTIWSPYGPKKYVYDRDMFCDRVYGEEVASIGFSISMARISTLRLTTLHHRIPTMDETIKYTHNRYFKVPENCPYLLEMTIG